MHIFIDLLMKYLINL